MNQAVIHLRISTEKGRDQTESLEVQEHICKLTAQHQGYNVKKVFKETYTGTKTFRPMMEEMFTYLENNPSVSAVIIRGIDRFTRAGSPDYDLLKRRLAQYNVRLIDSMGIIQPIKNTLDDVGFEYDWSKKSPSRIAENIQADIAQEEITTILTRMIGQEIRLSQKGFSVREAPFGFQNRKVTDEYGKKKTILVPHPKESLWIRTIFTLRSEGILSDEQICDRLNQMGFATRLRNKKDKRTGKVVGKIGGKELTPKRFHQYINKPIYAGIKVEKWTQYVPIKTPYDGLVSIRIFNRANRGKIKIIDLGSGQYEIKHGKVATRLDRKEDFPYRSVVRCPHCGSHFWASYSKGKTKRYPAYHCNKQHKYYRVTREKFHKIVEDYFKDIKFSTHTLTLLEAALLEARRNKEAGIVELSIERGKNVTELKARQKMMLDKLLETQSNIVQKKLEKEIEAIDKEIIKAQAKRNEVEISELMIKEYVAEFKDLIQNPAKMLLQNCGMRERDKLWGLFFKKLPTLNELETRTAELSLVVTLCGQQSVSYSKVVGYVRLYFKEFEEAILGIS